MSDRIYSPTTPPVLPLDLAGIRTAYEQLLGPVTDDQWLQLQAMAVRWARRQHPTTPRTP